MHIYTCMMALYFVRFHTRESSGCGGQRAQGSLQNARGRRRPGALAHQTPAADQNAFCPLEQLLTARCCIYNSIDC